MEKFNPVKKYSKKISIYTLVSNLKEYEEMVISAKNKGFDHESISFIYFDNSKNNDYDGYSAINNALKDCDAEYVIVCHQDILFEYDNFEKLIFCIKDLNEKSPNWAVAGNAGKDSIGNLKIKITDPNGENQSIGKFPEKVISLDENFLLINRKYNLSCSNQLSGFHLYGIDLCTNAINIGLECYVIDFHLHHKSAGNIGKDFFGSREKFIKMQENRLRKNFYSTTCSNFYIGKWVYLNLFINQKYVIRIYTFIRKLFSENRV